MAMTKERREAARERIFGRASVVFNGRQSMFDCSIRNWSEAGALVRLSDWTALPPTFEIDFANRGESVRVRQCWRHGDDVGVAFLREHEIEVAEPIPLERFRRSPLAAAASPA